MRRLTDRLESSANMIVLAILAILLPHKSTRADVVLDIVSVGNLGNAADATGFGSVAHRYDMGRFEVTNSQYTEFLNSVDPEAANALQLYNPFMSTSPSGGILRDAASAIGARYRLKSGRGDNPVNYVSDHDAMRFANWLHNGQNGMTETGAYTLLGNSAVPSNLLQSNRNTNAIWALPTEDEWYKAAYHRNDGVSANYSRYPTQSDAAPHSISPPGTSGPNVTNSANVFRDDGGGDDFNSGFATTGETTFPLENALVDVGSYSQTSSAYGMFDMAGSVHEWTEAFSGSNRVIRGGSYWSGSFGIDLDDATVRFADLPSGFEESDIGFRLVRLPTAVPEPSSLAVMSTFALLGVFSRRRRSISRTEKA